MCENSAQTSSSCLPRTKSFDGWISSSFDSLTKHVSAPKVSKKVGRPNKNSKLGNLHTSSKVDSKYGNDRDKKGLKHTQKRKHYDHESDGEEDVVFVTQNGSRITEASACKKPLSFVHDSAVNKSNSRCHFSRKNNKLLDKKVSFLDRCAPRDVSDLAVNPKKAQQVLKWLREHMGKPRILLLTGPSGCGKTATLKTISCQLNIDIIEWTNERLCQICTSEENQELEEVRFESQVKSFREFLKSADFCRPNANKSLASRRLIVVEEFPNAFARNPGDLHDILRNYSEIHRNPLVFIISDICWSRELSLFRLFPPQIIDSLGIDQIAFKSAASTFLLKALRNAVDSHTDNVFSAKSKQALLKKLKTIADTADGDIRSAMHNLELCLNGDGLLVLNQDQKSDTFGSSQQDGLDTFHALGKILYAKRQQEVTAENTVRENKFISTMKHLARPAPLSSDIDLVVSRCHLNADGLTDFLHENEPDFARNIEVLQRVTEDLSSVDFLGRHWQVREAIGQQYFGLIVAKSVAFWNYSEHGPKSHGFAQFRKPRSGHIKRNVEAITQQCATAFEENSRNWSTKLLLTEFIPFLDLTNYPVRDVLQQNALHLCNPNKRRDIVNIKNTQTKNLNVSINTDLICDDEQSDVEIESYSGED